MHLEASDFAALDDSQRLAVLETMIIGLIADDKIVPAEVRRFEEIVMGLPWGVEREVLAVMIKGARERLAGLKTQAEVTDYVARLAERLPSPDLRDKIVFTMATLMYSDGEVAQIEKNVLGLFVVAFNITSDRISRIRSALHIPNPVPPESTAN